MEANDELTSMINDAVNLKSKIDALKLELGVMQRSIAERVAFKDGKKSTTINAGRWQCKVVRTDRYKWDQDKLNVARAVMGDGEFLSLFGYEWKPLNKAGIDGFLQHAPQERKVLISDALTITCSTGVTFIEREVTA